MIFLPLSFILSPSVPSFGGSWGPSDLQIFFYALAFYAIAALVIASGIFIRAAIMNLAHHRFMIILLWCEIGAVTGLLLSSAIVNFVDGSSDAFFRIVTLLVLLPLLASLVLGITGGNRSARKLREKAELRK